MRKRNFHILGIMTIFLCSSTFIIAQETGAIKASIPAQDSRIIQEDKIMKESTTTQEDTQTYQSPFIYDRNNPFHILVNKKNPVGEQYKPDNLVIPNVKFSEAGVLEKKHMNYTAAYFLKLLFKAAEEENIHLVAVSGYRSYNRQKVLYNNYVRQHGQEATDRFSAKPGYSEHQTGLAMDVSAKSVGYGLVTAFGNTKEGQWLAHHAHEYGFIIRYPQDKEHITGYMYEPWHIRYVGKELATYLYINQVTLEEVDAFLTAYEKTLANEENIANQDDNIVSEDGNIIYKDEDMH